MNNPYLSIVVTTRNDNHGENLQYRMQHFLDGVIEQCKRHQLHAELIFVEWNPPQDRPFLSEALRFPEDASPCSIRIIRVPKAIHDQIEHSQHLPLFQMIGKNVGIKRARGNYVLATNIDVLFSDSLVRFIKNKIKPGVLYRVDRLDIPKDLPEVSSFSEILEFCKERYFRINGKYGTFFRNQKRGGLKKVKTLFSGYFRFSKRLLSPFLQCPLCLTFSLVKRLVLLFCENPIPKLNRGIRRVFLYSVRWFSKVNWGLKRSVKKVKNFLSRLHTNACGDFTLMAAENWARLRGYPEWHFFSWHLDSVLLFQAKNHKLKEVDLPINMPIYHIDHDSGYTPEKASQLFKRLEEKKIAYLTNDDFEKIANELRSSKEKIVYNDENWGLGNQNLEEITIGSCTTRRT